MQSKDEPFKTTTFPGKGAEVRVIPEKTKKKRSSGGKKKRMITDLVSPKV